MTNPADIVLKEAGKRAGVAVAPAELIRDGSHALFRLPDGIVARIGPAGSGARAQREIQISVWLAASGVTVVDAISGIAQPTLVNDHAVTWWHELSPHRPATPSELGAVLRVLHELPVPSAPQLPRLDPFTGIAERIDGAAGLAADDRSWLLNHLEAIRYRWTQLPSGRPSCVVHGDAWQGNVAVPDKSEPVLLDLEHVAVGPPEWDLLAIAVDRTDFERISAPEYRSFVDAYGGYDITTWPGYRTLADILELRWVCFAIGKADRDQPAAEEASHRIACLRGDIQRPWHWTAL